VGEIGGMMPYERLEAWKVSHELAVDVYWVARELPQHEQYGLASQIRRAAASIPTNLAEGAARQGPREFRRFTDIALGSLSELAYLLRLVRDLGMLDATRWAQLDAERDRAGKLVWGLHESLRKASASVRHPG
jgi:four helix bundle protein